MVTILLGSKSDLEWGKTIRKSLEIFGITAALRIASAHKTPEHLLSILKASVTDNDNNIFICVAGRSNALGGFVDANVSAVVINCPPYSEKYSGLDLLSSLRMPGGVAPLTVLEPDQAALAAAKILGQTDKNIMAKIKKFQEKMKLKIIADDLEAAK